MTNFIILDTNILISLGINIEENIDFQGIKDYCYSSGSEIIITKTIKNEYLDYYKTKILDRSVEDLNQVYEKLKKLEHFKCLTTPDLGKETNLQLAEINHFLNQYYKEPFEEYWLPKDELLNFLLDNKKENKKDNTRDYLIWRSTLKIASTIDNDQVILISNDKIFASNYFFEKMKKEEGIKNLAHYNSIASFLSVYGFKSENLNKQLILDSIPKDLIRKELLDHKDAILSYISKFYWQSNFKLEIESLKVQGLEVVSLYAHKDQETNLINVTTNVRVKNADYI